MNPIHFVLEMAEVVPPLKLPYDARVFLSRRVRDYCDRIEAESQKVQSDEPIGLSISEDFAVSATVSLYLNKAYPAWLWCVDCLIRVTRIPTESGQVWLLLTRSDESIGRLRPSGNGGVQ